MHSAAELERARKLFAAGVPKRHIANELGVAYRTIRDWLGPRPPAWTLDPPRSDCPRCELWHRASLFDDQYSYLLGQYLGDGSIATQRNGVHRLVISTTQSYPGISHEVATDLSYVLGAIAHEYVGGSPGVTLVSGYSKHWPCVFPQHGPGMKHTRPIELEPWQREIVEHNPEAFVRGLGRRTSTRCSGGGAISSASSGDAGATTRPTCHVGIRSQSSRPSWAPSTEVARHLESFGALRGDK